MKKVSLLLSVFCLFMAFSSQAVAQDFSQDIRYGVVGSVNAFSAISSSKDLRPYYRVQFRGDVGVTAEFPLAYGFGIQPSLLWSNKAYTVAPSEDKSSPIASKMIHSSSFIELPVQLQWGPDLVYFRPYVFVEPFVGYLIHNNTKFEVKSNSKSSVINNLANFANSAAASLSSGFREEFNKKENKLEYGASLGLGIEISHIQFTAKYMMSLNNIYNFKNEQMEMFNAKYQGVVVGLSVLF